MGLNKNQVLPAQARSRVAADPPTADSVRHRILRILWSARLVMPLSLLLAGMGATLLIAVQFPMGLLDQSLATQVLLASAIATLVGLVLTARRLRTQLLEPLARLEESVAKVCQGEPGATLSREDTGVLRDMVEDIDSINEELTDLYEDMDSRVARQTTRLAQKTASLKILYDVAASINQANNLDELLLRFLRVLKEMVNGMVATVRLVQEDGNMRLVGAIGLNDAVLTEQEMLPLDLCLCGTALSPGDILCEHPERHCARRLGHNMFGPDEVERVTVPLDYHGDVLGFYHVYVRKPGISGREDILELLKTVGSHLGMAVAKQRSDREARRLSIVEERTALAHELHDSLAQTLASLRFQVRMLQDVLRSGDIEAACNDLARISNGLDEAHTELRELLHSFRAPVGQRGLTQSLRALVERFQQESGIQGFFQVACREPELSSAEEMQILRIAQEALANIRKHAKAHTVRVLLNCQSDGGLVLLIEDDGVGFDNARRHGRPGEHIGLAIMEERAQRLGGTLRIESEPGEGTRLELCYKPATRKDEKPRRWLV
ncbi:ATP-binding protein [endosymbiont of unidentified scaly snail isolate Monju]|uniref:ATP-binding protein n=1 Tax=endosymbiont of unidentified scaly snail isolate Monju TaxID=1248727 RepID=UPI0003891DD7|nr:ATP-binding protein [endosymbiont of unidentified scaly snail isolate Monju]BAN68774.1 two-component system, NarL family, nitrate/nitrite sensor histidine kinase NarX [endosymbiont of unidentified scaly snail isolate Monju]